MAFWVITWTMHVARNYMRKVALLSAEGQRRALCGFVIQAELLGTD